MILGGQEYIDVSTVAGEVLQPVVENTYAQPGKLGYESSTPGINELLGNHLANLPDLGWFFARSNAGSG
jgi:hypothetical protein